MFLINYLQRVFATTVAFLIMSYLLSSHMYMPNILIALLVSCIVCCSNIFARFVLRYVSLPANLLTCGITCIVLNSLILKLLSAVITNHRLDFLNFKFILFAAMIIVVVNTFFFKKKEILY